jgi:hypothetical protein
LQPDGFVDAGLPDERLCCAIMVRCSNGDGRSQRSFAALSLTFTAEALQLNIDISGKLS